MYKNFFDVVSDVGDTFLNVEGPSIESSLFHLFCYTFPQTKYHTQGNE